MNYKSNNILFPYSEQDYKVAFKMSVNHVSSRQKHWIWSQKNLLRPPYWKMLKLLRKKYKWLMKASLHQKALFFVCLISETLILYRQSETNCSLETSRDNLNKLEHSIQKSFKKVLLSHLSSDLVLQLLFFIKGLWFCF